MIPTGYEVRETQDTAYLMVTRASDSREDPMAFGPSTRLNITAHIMSFLFLRSDNCILLY